MAKFYGSIKGNKGSVTRTGSRSITSSIQSYDGSIISNLYYNTNNEISVRIGIEDDSTSFGRHTYFDGTLEELKEALDLYKFIEENRNSEAEYYKLHEEEFIRRAQECIGDVI